MPHLYFHSWAFTVQQRQKPARQIREVYLARDIKKSISFHGLHTFTPSSYDISFLSLLPPFYIAQFLLRQDMFPVRWQILSIPRLYEYRQYTDAPHTYDLLSSRVFHIALPDISRRSRQPVMFLSAVRVFPTRRIHAAVHRKGEAIIAAKTPRSIRQPSHARHRLMPQASPKGSLPRPFMPRFQLRNRRRENAPSENNIADKISCVIAYVARSERQRAAVREAH
jgi:hypothetical protein